MVPNITLNRADSADSDFCRLFEQTYLELRRFAHGQWRFERRDHTLQPTAVTHEVFIRLFHRKAVPWNDQRELLLEGVSELRRVLVDHARSVQAQKRGSAVVKF